MLFLSALALAGAPTSLVRFGDAVYVSMDDELLRSTDGRAWTRVTPVLDGGLPVPVAAVAVAQDRLVLSTGAAFLHSTDGRSWGGRVDLPPPDDALWTRLDVPSEWVVAETEEGGMILSSDRGETWEEPSTAMATAAAVQRGHQVALDDGQYFELDDLTVRVRKTGAELTKVAARPLGVGFRGGVLATWESQGELIVRRGGKELRTAVEAGVGDRPVRLSLVTVGNDLLVAGTIGLYRLDAAGAFTRVEPLEGLAPTTAWGARALPPTGEKVVPWDSAELTLTLPAPWRAREDAALILSRPALYGAPAEVAVERHVGQRCAEVRQSPPGDDWDYVTFPAGFPQGWAASPVVRIRNEADWSLCVERPSDAWRVSVRGADPAVDAETAQVLANVATAIEAAPAAEGSTPFTLPTEDESGDIGALAGLVIESQMGVTPTPAFHSVAARLDTALLGHPEDWFNVHINLGLGATTDTPGFLYDLGLGLGAGHQLGHSFTLGVFGGIGLDGSAPAEPFALRTPAGLVVLLSPGGPVAFALRAEADWWFATTRAQSTGPLGVDRVRATLDMALGGANDPDEGKGATGFLFGVVWEHLDGAERVGLRIGLGSVTNAR